MKKGLSPQSPNANASAKSDDYMENDEPKKPQIEDNDF